MKVLFVSISPIADVGGHSISLDLLREFKKGGHEVYIVCALERKQNMETYLSDEAGCKVLRVKIGNNKKTGVIEKGITTVLLPSRYIKAIKKYFSDIKFDLVLYPTPPVTHYATVKYIKKRDNAKTYLVLKDIFPQNAVDIGMMTKHGVKGILYKYFRRKEKKLYAISDRIGCMSQANVDYVLKHNPEVPEDKVEICPNAIEIQNVTITEEQKLEVRRKYGIPLDKKVFVYGGNLGRPQGIPFIIECLKTQINNPDAYFLVVGDGTEYGKLETFFNSVNAENMKLMKRLPKEDYDRMVAACDVGMIFLDHRFTIPNFPSRLLAYMQAELPVLASTDPNTDIGKVIVDGDFGWWCESDDIQAFKKCVDDALKSDLKSVGKTGFKYLEDHYTSKSAYETIISKL
ncbi:MAG: glycosyltransferase family 4 protein [Ruminococcaceae bacterium]|nr:glycosyltransferase family 4 protein [Oscillospiraceae bacterium]